MKGFTATPCMALGLALALSLGIAQARDGGFAEFVDGAAYDVRPGEWDGGFRFKDVYCATFPLPEHATRRVSALLNGNAVSLARVEYDQPFEIYLVSSTMPAGMTADEEHREQVVRAQAAADATPGLYRFDTTPSPMGPVIRRQLTNVTHGSAEQGQNPFPLDMRFFDSPDAIRTIAETRLFSRVPDRFEVAVLAGVPDNASDREVSLVRQVMASFADDVTASLQDCTAAMPARRP